MAKEIDPNNVTGADVLRAIIPIVAAIIALYLVKEFAPKFFGIALLALLAFTIYGIFTTVDKNSESIGKAGQAFDDKVGSIPVVGPLLAAFSWTFDRVGTLVTIISIILLAIWAIKQML